MQDTKQLNVKLPSDLYALILESGRSRKDVIIDALNMYFYANKHNQDAKAQQDSETTTNALISQLSEKDRQISELHIMLQNAMSQNLIPSPKDQYKKSWWKFWN